MTNHHRGEIAVTMDKTIERQTRCAIMNITSYWNEGSYRPLFQFYAYSHPVFVLLVILSNFLLIFGICKTNKKLSSTNISFIWLSIQDIAMMLTQSTATYIHLAEHIPCTVTFILNALNTCFIFSSMFTFCTISFFRYLKLRNPLKQIRSRSIYIVLAVEFTSSMLVGGALITLTYIGYFNTKIVNGIVLSTGGVFILVLVIVLTINIKSYSIIDKQIKLSFHKVNDIELETINNTAITNTSLHSLASSKKLKSSVVTLIMITCSYLFCFTPFSLYLMITGFMEFHAVVKLYGVLLTLSLLLHANSGINSMIFVIRSKVLRNYYTKCFRSKRTSRHMQHSDDV